MSAEDIVIMVCGHSGAGKSIFINTVAPDALTYDTTVSRNLMTWLLDFIGLGEKGGELDWSGKTVHVSRTKLFGKMVTFVDMPSHLKIDELKKVKLEGKSKSWKPDWWIYLYKIDGNRENGVREDITVIKAIDGGAGEKMTFVTAFWTGAEATKEQLRQDRFTELTAELKGYGMKKPHMERFAGTRENASDERSGKAILKSILERVR